jgi:signal transduction histidine kinase
VRRRLLGSTLAIALVCVIVLGVPLAVLARHQVWTSARDRIAEQAASIATAQEDRLDAGQPVDLTRFARLMPDRRIVVRPAHGTPVAVGPILHDGLIQASVVVADSRITVQAPRSPTVSRAREVTLIVVGLALLAAVAAVGLALWQSRRIGRPIGDLVDRAEALGHGTIGEASAPSGVPEIDRIAHVLERSAHRIGTLMDLQREFAADAAHQLRTPLTSIGLHLEEILHVGDRESQQEADHALAQVDRLDGVISSLLGRALGDSAEPTLLDLGLLLQDGSAPWERVLTRAARRLTVHVAPQVMVEARREHLLGIVGSLLDNAVTHGSGEVTASVSRADGHALLRVADEGRGVPEPMRTKIFDRRVSGNNGTGIGLALARSLAEAEEGTLTVSSERPAEFVLLLPLAD